MVALADKYDLIKERSRITQRKITEAGKEIGQLPSVVDPDRRDRCERNLKLWLESYCPRAVRLGWSADHLELLEALETVLLYGGQLAIGMPRGTGKSTIVSLGILWAILYGHHQFIALIAATDPKAKALIDAIKKQVEINDLLLEDFPEACYPVRCLGGVTNRQAGQTCDGERTLIEWGKESIVFPTIKGSVSSGASLIAGGITGAITRGPQRTLDSGEIIRPSVALIDDFQTRESARSPQQVQDRLDIINADVSGMAGPDRKMSILSTVTVIYPGDGADQLLDIDKRPEWGGIRKRFVVAMPSKAAMKLWEQYAEIYRQSMRTYRDARLATAFYAENQAAMDEGCVVSWDKRFTQQSKVVDGVAVEIGEISAIQFAMNWYLIKPEAFASELQNDPRSGTTNSRGWLLAKDIEQRTSRTPRFLVPELLRPCEKVVAHIDVHDDVLYYSVLAFADNASAVVIDYGTYPEQRRAYFQKSQATRTMRHLHKGLGKEGAIAKGLETLAKTLLDRGYTGEAGNEWQVAMVGVDSGHNKTVVNSVLLSLMRASQYKHRLSMTKGFGVRAMDTPLSERKHKPGTRSGNNCYQPPRDEPKTHAPELNIDTNYWKTVAQDRWALGDDEPGAVRLYAGGDHQGYSEHQKAEVGTENTSRGRSVWEFRQLPTDNHWHDTHVSCLAIASFIGVDVPENRMPVARRKKRKFSISF